MEPGFEDEGALVTVRAREGICAGEGAKDLVPGLGRDRLGLRVDAEEKTHACDTATAVAVGQDAPSAGSGQAACRILSLDTAGEQLPAYSGCSESGTDVLKEAADELEYGERRWLAFLGIVWIPSPERDGVVGHAGDAVVGDGDAMGVTAEVAEELLRTGERRLGVDDPVGRGEFLEHLGEDSGISE